MRATLAVWRVRWPAVSTWVVQGLRNVRPVLADVAAVAWCALRGRHFLAPDFCGVEWNGTEYGFTHVWCEACGWCSTEGERRRDLVGVPCAERGQEPPVVLP